MSKAGYISFMLTRIQSIQYCIEIFQVTQSYNETMQIIIFQIIIKDNIFQDVCWHKLSMTLFYILFSTMTCFDTSLADLLSFWLRCFPSSLNSPPRSFSPRGSPESSHQLFHLRHSSLIVELPSSSEIDQYFDKKSNPQPQPQIPMTYGPSCSNYLWSAGMFQVF